jgi:7,8-dihydropterin-6-yl-methyl-4-(beta-D-ribofuranosyl)aminobenzene 5'-phosphate synthase
MTTSREISITVLMENSALHAGLAAEHGLSLHLAGAGAPVVFDTGQSDACVRNAAVLGVDLAAVRQVALSHGHYDHSGGLPAVLAAAPAARVLCHPGALARRYSVSDPAAPRENGMPAASRACLVANGFVGVDQPCRLDGPLHLTGPVPRENDFEDTGGPFFLDPAGTIPDPIDDDQALWFVASQGLVIVLGCAHAGVVNTINHCRRLAGTDRVHALIGGLHLVNAKAQRMEQTIGFLRGVAPDILAAGHCTGAVAMEHLQQEFPGAYQSCAAGSVFHFQLPESRGAATRQENPR